MKFENIKFPALIVLLIMVLTPLVVRWFALPNTVNYVVVGACAVSVIALVVVGAINTIKDKR